MNENYYFFFWFFFFFFDPVVKIIVFFSSLYIHSNCLNKFLLNIIILKVLTQEKYYAADFYHNLLLIL